MLVERWPKSKLDKGAAGKVRIIQIKSLRESTLIFLLNFMEIHLKSC